LLVAVLLVVVSLMLLAVLLAELLGPCAVRVAVLLEVL